MSRPAGERLRGLQPASAARAAGSTPTGPGRCAAPLDRLVGGVGLRRGRRDPDELRVGDALDFWRVEAVEPARLLRLRAEMKVPGLGLAAVRDAAARRRHAARADGLLRAAGVPGLAYWYALFPVHSTIFSGMIAALAAEASRPAGRGGAASSRVRDRSPSAARCRGVVVGLPEEETLPHWVLAVAAPHQRHSNPFQSAWTSSSRRPGTSSLCCSTSCSSSSGSPAPTGSSRTLGGASTTRSSSRCACSPASCSGRWASSSTPSCGLRSCSPIVANRSSKCR